jgi:pilus assembly protein CpaC
LRALEQDRRAEVLGQPVIRLAAGQEAELTMGGEFQVIEHVVREPTGDEAPTRSSWKQHGLTLKTTATPFDAQRVRLAYDLSLKTRSSQSETSLTVNDLKSEVDVRVGSSTMVGLLDVKATGDERERLPVLGGIPIIGPLFSSRGSQQTRSRLLLWMRLDADDDASELSPAELRN